MASVKETPGTNEQVPVDVEAIIIGAGFGGLRSLWELRSRGISSKVLEKGSNVGGTWYWNRYPGARTDSESWVYCYSFDKDLLQEWDWKERFPTQSEVQAYLEHVADRHDMRKDIEFGVTVTSAIFDENSNVWTVTTDAGATYTSRYVVAATGQLGIQHLPVEGVENFKGIAYHSSSWPKEPVSFEGKRVAVIGTGATGIQIIPLVAQEAGSLTVFQRTPNFVMPARNYALTETHRAAIKRDYDDVWAKVSEQPFGMAFDPVNRVLGDTEPASRDQVLEAGWEAGGFRYVFETFDDLLTDEECNAAASEFVRNKIRAIVKDPATAELLCPTDHPVGGKRVPLGHFYYETFNRDNVSLVDVNANPIERFTENGLMTADGELEFDVVIIATGFDAVSGALTHMDVRGRQGLSMKERWADGAESFMGVMVDGFPNFFTILGPQGPFSNNPPVIEHQAEWVGKVITYCEQQGLAAEVSTETVESWYRTAKEAFDSTVLAAGEQAHSWYLGANIPGKAHRILYWFGGSPAYNDMLDRTEEAGFHLIGARQAAPVA
ncbi:NAD(P)/FAD-dependent oxidoreductase [Paenarthrobacter sp. AT5]|uniref:flavin-containing monooxygenase n=1 Tax=Paenarthrobacter TaxID=1742992 RepID=UPI001A97F692|nr:MULTISPECIES: NAD(P)/FAD-dependent oxidoreductase [Paenarthrobacter]QSZ53923.1 cyclohexanone monooxygenase [Paenarthrobacter ureafaciens]WOC62704.1 NAD(P)/FAD-dependent oxidoreductase [Paenarthrobacter sp. AT5]